MDLSKRYIDGLKKAYFDNGVQEIWECFEDVVYGATKKEMKKLKKIYPNICDSLIQLLEFSNGTYWSKYGNTKVSLPFLGSDIEKCPYYWLSVEEMLINRYIIISDYPYYITRKDKTAVVDEKVTDCIDKLCWLNFCECTTREQRALLYIDYSPSKKGVKGQILRFSYELAEIKVIANSFDEYLQMLMDRGYDFIDEKTMEHCTCLILSEEDLIVL